MTLHYLIRFCYVNHDIGNIENKLNIQHIKHNLAEYLCDY